MAARSRMLQAGSQEVKPGVYVAVDPTSDLYKHQAEMAMALAREGGMELSVTKALLLRAEQGLHIKDAHTHMLAAAVTHRLHSQGVSRISGILVCSSANFRVPQHLVSVSQMSKPT